MYKKVVVMFLLIGSALFFVPSQSRAAVAGETVSAENPLTPVAALQQNRNRNRRSRWENRRWRNRIMRGNNRRDDRRYDRRNDRRDDRRDRRDRRRNYRRY